MSIIFVPKLKEEKWLGKERNVYFLKWVQELIN